MGADLLCYIVKGPKTFSQLKLRAAEKHIRLVQALLKTWEDLGDTARDSDDPAVRNIVRLLPKEMFREGSTFNDVAFLKDKTPKAILEDLQGLWHGDFRDSATRVDPDDRRQLILVAGDTSWGDEPEGSGFQTMKNTEMLGLFPVLGIK